MVRSASVPLSQANPLKSLLDQAGIGKDSLIRVTGPSGLSALLWLCRRGYDRVGYVRPGQGCPHEEPDALLVAHTCDAACLGRLLATGPYVREGGVLIFRSPQPDRAGPGGDPIHRILERGGYAVERCLHGAHRELHVARRVRHVWRQAA